MHFYGKNVCVLRCLLGLQYFLGNLNWTVRLVFLLHSFSYGLYITLPTAEILSGKNARAFLVYGFLMKKIVGAVWKLPAK